MIGSDDRIDDRANAVIIHRRRKPHGMPRVKAGIIGRISIVRARLAAVETCPVGHPDCCRPDCWQGDRSNDLGSGDGIVPGGGR